MIHMQPPERREVMIEVRELIDTEVDVVDVRELIDAELDTVSGGTTKMSFLSNTARTSITTVGNALETMARKQ
jgi:hypothetical protein